MRLKLMLCSVTTLFPALILAGCGVDQTSSMVTSDTASPAITGRAFGGQQPVVGATIEVVAMGTSGYGSVATVVASTPTLAGGVFSFPAGAYTCDATNPTGPLQADTPMYLLGVAGNPGLPPGSNNPSAVEAAALGPCLAAKSSTVILNEVTTAATAFVFSHFFSTATPVGGVAGGNDSIGGPSTSSGTTIVYSQGLVMGNNFTYPTLVNNANGGVHQNSSTTTIEASKINTIADILAECINSTGSTSSTETKTQCGKLFNNTANGAAIRPVDTFQAAVQMALFPASKVTALYNLIGGNAPFLPYMSAAPNDWTIGVSYTTSSLGLAVDAGTTSTLDIDSTGRVWFPSNASGQVGAAYFDPTSQSFNGPFNTTTMVHPQQVVIDATGYAWYNDTAGPNVSGYLTSSPGSSQSVSLSATQSNSLTVGGDDRINVGVTSGSTYLLGVIPAPTTPPTRNSYSTLPGVVFVFPAASLADEIGNNVAVSGSNPTTTRLEDYYVTPGPPTTNEVIATANSNSAQALYTGNDDVVVRSYAGNAGDGLCIFSRKACSNFAGAAHNVDQGIAIDGGKNLWVAESGDSGILQIPVNSPGAAGAAVYLNSSGANNVPNNEFLHDATNAGTTNATAPTPFGIGIDATGNVWVTNAGCNVANCTPGAFTLTEIVGAGYPTITPVSAQITSGINLVGTEPTH